MTDCVDELSVGTDSKRDRQLEAVDAILAVAMHFDEGQTTREPIASEYR